ncbi:MAG TPA: hypothetical protein VFC68_02275 [Treponemataceae bacterium]|nr:hypothetical protein [Treponemataceae bacterium]
MTTHQWNAFCAFKNEFKAQIQAWNSDLLHSGFNQILKEEQKRLAYKDGVPPYPIDTTLVYNKALDEITDDDDIKLIIIGDNPGKDEQRAENRRYLVGHAGKIAEGFFRRNPELGIDFRKNVIILNKTPLHTAKTKELKALTRTSKNDTPKMAQAREYFAKLLLDSQVWMATRTAKLHSNLNKDAKEHIHCQLWLVGYSELKKKGIFLPYADVLTELYSLTSNEQDLQDTLCKSKIYCHLAESVFVFQHFSMNRFLIDIRAHSQNSLNLQENIEAVGRMRRKQILSF